LRGSHDAVELPSANELLHEAVAVVQERLASSERQLVDAVALERVDDESYRL
jgi:hypothetical protein